MWAEALGLAVLAVASAVVPLINIEAIIVVAASQDRVPSWLLVAAATVRQLVSKLLWYYGGRELERFGFVARRMSRPRRRRPWSVGTRAPRAVRGSRPVSCSSLLPEAFLAVVAGALRVRLWVFIVTGLVGRAIRFWAIIGRTTTVLSWW